MVKVIFDNEFKKRFSRITDNATKSKLLKQIKKIGENLELGKPMCDARKGTRELYVAPL